VALVVMAFVTSALAVLALRILVGRRPHRRLLDDLRAEGFVPDLAATDAEAAIRALADAAGRAAGVDPAALAHAVIQREHLAPTGAGEEVAVPHARIAGLAAPVVAIGLSRSGIDFGGPDGTLARSVVLIVTPDPDAGVQVELIADARALRSPSLRERVVRAERFSELRAALLGT
jgi:PTS system nitrogen regulatory IIA component